MNLNKIEKVMKNMRNLIIVISFIFAVALMVWSFDIPPVSIEEGCCITHTIYASSIMLFLLVPLLIIISLCIGMNNIHDKTTVLVMLVINAFSIGSIIVMINLLRWDFYPYLVEWNELLEVYFNFVGKSGYILLILLISLIVEVVIEKKKNNNEVRK